MKLFDFKGRATRGEWWGLSILFSVIEFALAGLLGGIGAILSLILVIPSLAVSIRRMHDLDKSGWWLLVPIYSWILVWFVPGTSGSNSYDSSGGYSIGEKDKKCKRCETIYSSSMSTCPKCGSAFSDLVPRGTNLGSIAAVNSFSEETKKCQKCGERVKADEFKCPKCKGEAFI
jgi:RNA polymerase subunit RPABC4/transcription elongation factor Spt4